MVDTDGDMRLSLNEVAIAMKTFFDAPEYDRHWLKSRWSRQDFDGDGWISLDEFRQGDAFGWERKGALGEFVVTNQEDGQAVYTFRSKKTIDAQQKVAQSRGDVHDEV